MQGLAATKPPHREQTPTQETMRQQGLPGIFRTTRSKTAARPGTKNMLQRREKKLIAAHQASGQAGGERGRWRGKGGHGKFMNDDLRIIKAE
jgi:hypothetical protein